MNDYSHWEKISLLLDEYNISINIIINNCKLNVQLDDVYIKHSILFNNNNNKTLIVDTAYNIKKLRN